MKFSTIFDSLNHMTGLNNPNTSPRSLPEVARSVVKKAGEMGAGAKKMLSDIHGIAEASLLDFSQKKLHVAPRNGLQAIVHISEVSRVEKVYHEKRGEEHKKNLEATRKLFQSSVDYLKNSNDPKMVVLGYDMEIADMQNVLEVNLSYAQRIITEKRLEGDNKEGWQKELDNALSRIGYKNENGKLTPIVDKSLDARIKQLQEDRDKQFKEKQPSESPPENEIEMFVKKLESDAKKEALIKKNPVGYLFDVLFKDLPPIGSKEFGKAFTEKYKNVLKEDCLLVQTATENAHDVTSDWKVKIKKAETLGVMGFIAFLLALFASNQQNKGGGGGGMHG